MASDLDGKIQEVYRHIQAERKILEGAQALRQATNNQDVLRKNEATIRETERSLSYFEDTLRELQSRKAQQSDGSGRSGGPGSPPVPPKVDNYMDPSRTSTSSNGPRPRNFTNLDLIKAETPHTPAKISKMLHQLEFKLQVEMQYKKGIDKMAKLYQADGDKKSRADAESKKVESEKKIQLLQTALKRYKNLHILDDVVEEEDPNSAGVDGERKDNLRSKPLSGILHVTVKGARELDHAPVVARFRPGKQVVETSVSVKVEGTQLARSHPSRTDRWNEDFEITVDKANEVEIAVYDKQVGEQHAIPIGLLWIRISDLVEALRRQKVMQEGQGGWVTAGAMHGDSHQGVPPGAADMNAPLDFRAGAPDGPPMGHSSQPSEGIDAWFAVEPAGAILLNLNFIKENVRKRPMDAPLGGLGRQGAVRKRKGEVHEMNGHKFVQKQFYNLMLCAFCSDFLLNATGYQCEDCRYTCHKKCHEKVVTKCISKSNTGEDEEKLNHRIPHRFEPLTNIGANWCCHCGYMLPFGRKNARKCSECDITCHANCAHLVPDFCGMSMETASAILSDLRDIKRHQASRPGPAKAERPPAPPTEQFGRVGISTPEPAPPVNDPYARLPPSQVAPGYADPRYQQPQPGGLYSPQGPSPGAKPPGQRIPPPPVFPEAQPARPQSGSYEQQGGYPGPRPPQPSPAPGKGLPSSPAQRYPDRTSSIPAPQQLPPRQQTPVRQQTLQKRKVGLDDFNFLAVLGKGNFGKVMLAEEKKTNGLYAIKVLKKEFIIDNDEVESTRSEKRVFLAAAKERHPFLLGLHSCFQTETRVYFVMEYVSGGDLMLHIQRKQFSLRQAKFYASEVLLALEYFHANGIIYRDLKLDNILLTLDGHVKVADYGLCKEDMWYGSTTSTFCGTPEFMAPEILLEQRYGRAVDWWAFGVLTYEMLLGQSPFRGEDEDEIFDAILEDEPLYPITMPRDAVSILQKLLTRDPSRRLGSTKEDAEEIKRQPFFKDVNWDDVLNKRIPPPYFPTINGSADTSNFDEEFTREQPTLTPVHGQLSARDQAEFSGFSYVASWADI
ncbi:protein kinase c [Moniliophthora roreri MCA 2997]|uniref:protein kinase C n=1 Tax=Moniliophthora roreri (strain MCA 2997) TaxID=1381753 RepID=V2YVT6_MONRO|nr:protein kinase c [Moniliophthora roreri MCA 2997]KAI3616156.1 protein kinase c [Moniliophthora roreri]